MATSTKRGHPIEYTDKSWRWSDTGKASDDDRPCQNCGEVAVRMLVPIPAHLSHTGKACWAVKPIDACLAPLVRALSRGGVYPANCCCGHGKGTSEIILHDGRRLRVLESEENDG